MYRAKVLAHSVGPDSPPLMTVEIEYPRRVLAETATHRVCRDSFGSYELVYSERSTTEDISKNSASSRAIPFKRMVEKVKSDPYIPEKFSKNGPGMQGHGWLEGIDHGKAVMEWLIARDEAVARATHLHELGAHKQDVNRLLEPWAWVTQVMTADEWGWNNFFTLRCDSGADPAFQKIARMIYLAKRKSVPEKLEYGQWHLPFVKPEEKVGFVWNPINEKERHPLPDLIQFSAARCAWVSYENHQKEGSAEQMKATYAKLMAGAIKHCSPVEHQATPMHPGIQSTPFFRSNLRGWIQARKLIPNERMDTYSPSEDEIQSWGLS